MIEASNLSNQEYYRLNGCLSQERIEELVSGPDIDFDELRRCIIDAESCLPKHTLFDAFLLRLKREIGKSLPELVEQFEELNTLYQENLSDTLDELELAKDELP